MSSIRSNIFVILVSILSEIYKFVQYSDKMFKYIKFDEDSISVSFSFLINIGNDSTLDEFIFFNNLIIAWTSLFDN